MMAGPQLAGILPDDGHLLQPNETLNVAPLDLTFRFDENQVLDFNTAATGIQIWRAGFDGVFTPASATSDFNTSGAALIRFDAKTLGTSQNGIQVVVTKSDHGGVSAPKITVAGTTISIDLNARIGQQSTAQDLVTAVNANPQASALVTAVLASGSGNTNITSPTVNYSPLVLSGANAASSGTDMNTLGAVQLKFTAAVAGAAGNGTKVVFTKANLAAGAQPVITVSGKTVTVQLNNTNGSKTKASDLVTALKNNAAASALVSAIIISGSGTTDVTTPIVNNTTLTLDGANDVLINPGYIGKGESDREIIARFKDRLPDDKYHIDIIGSTSGALKNDQGEVFNAGVNVQRLFELDLGAQVIAVVPQPVDRLANGSLSHRRNQIDVYFNNDDLWPSLVTTVPGGSNPTVVDPRFYRLIYTKNTVENTDDETILPVSVTYDPATDKAVLTFSANIESLPTGAGTYRLRIGTSEVLPQAPSVTAPKATVSSDLNTGGLVSVRLDAVTPGEAGGDVAVTISRANLGLNTPPKISVFGTRISVTLNNTPGSRTTAQQLITALNTDAAAGQVVRATLVSGNGAVDIASPNAVPLTLDLAWSGGQGSSFDTATNFGTLGTQSIVYTAAVDPQIYTLAFPGDSEEPGHRDTNLGDYANHVSGGGDDDAGITTVFYNFQKFYGTDPYGNALANLITDNQKQRAREIFEILGEVAGLQFVETASQGITMVTGDMRAINPFITVGAGFPYSISSGSSTAGMVILDNGEPWSDLYGGNWFQRAMHEVMSVLGLGNSHDLPPSTIQGQDGNAPTLNPLDNVNSSQVYSTAGNNLAFDNLTEPDFPGDDDIVHLQYLYRPESKDIDLYEFTLTETGLFSAETIAERRFDSSLLDSALQLWQEVAIKDANGNVIETQKKLVAQNDDYYSKDSYLEMTLGPGKYWVGVSASGNTSYNPTIEDTGLGGTTQGEYDLRLNFRPSAVQSIVDTTGTAFDGDADGTPGGTYNFWFRAQTPGNTIYVDKSAASGGSGTLTSPRNNLGQALSVATPGQIVRVVGNNGTDGNSATLTDNTPYEFGFNSLGTALSDGSTFDVPKDVTVMVDAGAIFKMRRSAVNVGSTSPTVDRSGGALQVLGTPTNKVYFTSYDDATIGKDTNPDTVAPAPGNWGGLAFRADVDNADATRFNYAKEGIFLNYVNNADLRYGGGNVVVASVAQIVNPIHMVDARPTVTFNQITLSADAAMSASPNSFQEDNFHAPQYQRVAFTSDYNRVGPEIHGNSLVDAAGNSNSLNGLLVRVQTPAGNTLRKLTVPGRMDDRDIVHIISENLVVEGTPGGPLEEIAKPTSTLITTTRRTGGGLSTFSAGNYNYRLTFIDSQGNEGLASDATSTVTIATADSVRLANLPAAPSGFTARRLYRSQTNGAGPYVLVAQLNASDTSYTDVGTTLAGILDERERGLRPRLDARLAIDPAIVVKLSGAGIQTNMGAQLLAEATPGLETVFTSLADDRYGAGGTFLTRADGSSQTTFDSTDANGPKSGDWSGLFLGSYSSGSLDNVVIAGAGGITRVEGNFTGFNALEIHQSKARVTNTVFEYNSNGLGGQASTGRFGRGFNEASTIFVRGSQPIIVDNTLRHNDGPAISINVNSLNYKDQTDYGRSIGGLDAVPGYIDNQGPLVRENTLDDNAINGMVVRGETLTTESVWDDTDIVHVQLDTVYVYDFHTFRGLRLESNPGQSLVVKSRSQDRGGNDANIPDFAGIMVNGRPLEIDDRIGGILQVLGQPGFPVVMTSLVDDTAGAGYRADGQPQNDTDNGLQTAGALLPTGPEVNNGLLIDNDVPVNTVGHFEVTPGAGGQLNQSGVTAQGLSQLFVNQDYVFAFQNFIDVGSNGGAVNLAATTITQPPTLVSPDLVISRGTFPGANGVVNWEVETRLDNGVARVINTLRLTSATPLGNVRFINYLDEDVLGVSDDLLWVTGTPGQADFRAYTLDDSERIGFSHGGFYLQGPELVNATYDGWAADRFPDLTTIIAGAGTTYSAAGNIDTVDLPAFVDPQLGNVNGLADITTAFAWSATPGATSAVMTSFLELVPKNPVSDAIPGDWQGIGIGQYAHDRNVETVTENEVNTANPAGRNGTPTTAQYLGSLGAYEKEGDENLRLGFTVHGTIANPADLDVYSFNADPGTTVWLDIDRTTQALDTVVELVDDNGTILAQSDKSTSESEAGQVLYTDGVTKAGPMTEGEPFGEPDRYTINPRDAGMRVILPGEGVNNTYHVRVRASNRKSGDPASQLQDLTKVSNGLTTGNYRLQVRLRELDEIGGTTVRYGDIRYASDGIKVEGQPTHSPLLGEASERNAANDSLGTAQNLGNLLTSDRGAISVGGQLSFTDPVDWYQVNATYTELESAVQAVIAASIDVDYADGMARPDTYVAIFDSTGRLVYFSGDSNVAEDRPQPLAGSSVSDLNRGSVGAKDPYAGSMNLVTGPDTGIGAGNGTYYIAISNQLRIPQSLEQFYVRLPANPLVRLEPNSSLIRIAEDHVNPDVLITAQAPLTPDLVNDSSAVPYTLGDIVMFVSYDNSTFFDRSTLVTVNPFTGQWMTIVNNNEAPFGYFDYDVGDIAMRADGRLYGMSLDVEDAPIDPNGPTDAESGILININTGNGTATVIRDDGIETFIEDPASPGTAAEAGVGGAGVGIQFTAVTFTPASLYGAERLLAVGQRPDEGVDNGVAYKRNILYRFSDDPSSATNLGQALPNPGADRYRGAGTDALEIGRVTTGGELSAAEATTSGAGGATGTTVFNIDDAVTFNINDGFEDHIFEFDAGPDVWQNINETATNQQPARTVRDGYFFVLDPDVNVAGDESVFQYDTGPVIVVNNSTGLVPYTFTVNDGVNSETFEFTDAGFNGGKPQNPNNTAIDVTGFLTPLAVAGFIAAAINGGSTNVTAAAVGNRVTLDNEIAAQSSVPGGALQIVGDRGAAPILEAVPGNQLFDTQTFSLQFAGVGTFQFEFDNNGVLVNAAAIRVPFTAAMTVQQVAGSLQTAISNAIATRGLPVAPAPQLVTSVPDNYGRVVVNGRGLTFLPGTSPVTDMLQRLSPRSYQIDVEENMTASQVGGETEYVVNIFTRFTASSDLSRINFPPPKLVNQCPLVPGDCYSIKRPLNRTPTGNVSLVNRVAAEDADFLGVPVWVDQGAAYDVALGNNAIPFWAIDSASQVARQMEGAINAANIPGVTAIRNGSVVTIDGLLDGSITATAPITGSGNGPGGYVTGMASVAGGLYVVTDTGGLYRIDPDVFSNITEPPFPPERTVPTQYIGSSRDDLLGIRFAGLAAGPQNVEGGAYANLLFGIDIDGRLYAFNTAGVLQPIFVNGQTSVDTGVSGITGFDGTPDGSDPIRQYGVQGMAFSTLDSNLWHQTPNQPVQGSATPMDVRLGVAPTVGNAITIDSRQNEVGHGQTATYDTARGDTAGLSSYHFGQGRVGNVARTYDFPGGAQGTVITEEFSLKGYTAADEPMLYFTYHSDNENTGTYDSLRVFASDVDGSWVSLATNSGALYNNTGSWRQARVDLSAFAGMEGIRLRFDFSTAGDMNLGDPNTTGSELWARSGSVLRDGQTFQIDNEIYEFDLGYTVVPPSGAALVDGETFTITDQAGFSATYEFDSDGTLNNPANVRILLDPSQTAADMARLIYQAVRLNGPANVTPIVNDNRVNLQQAVLITQSLAPGETQLGMVLEGNFGVNPTNVAVPITQAMTSTQVAAAIDTALQATFKSQHLIASAGLQYNDGDAFQLNDGTQVVNFEFDSGYILTLPATGGLGIFGGDPTGTVNPRAGDTLVIFDATTNRNVVLEFDKPGTNGVLPGRIAVPITDASSVLAVAQAIQRALLNAAPTTPNIALLGIANPQVLSGSRLQLGGVGGTLVKSSNTNIVVQGTPGASGAVEFQVPGALGIRVPGAGGPIIKDGESFTIGDGTNAVTFEMSTDGIPNVPGRVAIPFSQALPGGAPQIIANQIISAINTEVTAGRLIGLTPTLLFTTPTDIVIDLGSDQRHTLNVANTLLVGLGQAGAVVDGESFTLSDGNRTFTFELNLVGGTTLPGNIPITYAVNEDPDSIATKIAGAVAGVGLTGFSPSTLTLGRVLLGEQITSIVNSAGLINIDRTGVPGDNVYPVFFSPSGTFDASDVAQALANAINSSPLNVTASINGYSQRRVTLNGSTLTLQLSGTPVASSVSPPLSFEATTNFVKTYKNKVQIVGHVVNDQGPLGLADSLPGDVASSPYFRPFRVNYNGAERGQNNVFEGVYLDDFVIGFRERGEIVSGTNANSNYIANPNLVVPFIDVFDGTYQLEVRRSEEYSSASIPTGAFRSFDTNDRLATGVTLVAQDGSRIVDGQTFTLSDGVNRVTFEYDDQSILPGNPSYGIEPGRLLLKFNPSDPDYVVAATIRDAINSSGVQAVLNGVSAALSDGTDGVVRTGPSTSNKVDVFGPVALISHGSLVPEANDTIATATDTGIVGINSPNFKASGEIGDNPNFTLERGRDVDMFRVFLNAGETLTIDVDANEIGSTLNPVLAVFNANGAALAFNDAAVGPGELPSTDPFISFTPAIAGFYYIGVSGSNGIPASAPFSLYDPNFEGSLDPASRTIGFYELEVTFGDPGRSDYVYHTSYGDQNRFRDQGQILLVGNTVSNSANYGIAVTAGTPDAGSNNPHQGSVRQLRELNFDNLAPGVVVANNLVYNNRAGGILVSGDAASATAPIPFARIINNTVVGVGGTLIASIGQGDIGIRVENNASPTLLNNIVANTGTAISIDNTSTTTVVGGSIYQGNVSNLTGIATEDFPLFLANTDPLFVNPDKANFYLKKGSPAIDSSVDSLLERAALQTVKAPLGIASSPILAPDRDLLGLLRVDDPSSSPSGYGENPFKDRGAIDRADFTGPKGGLINPKDEVFSGSPPASTTPVDQNGAEGLVQLSNSTLYDFSIQLVDGVEPADPVNGVGVDDETVTKDKVLLIRDTQLLVEGIDYKFTYDATNNVVHLKPLAGLWDLDRVYVIDLVNRDQFTLTAPSGNQVVEGQTFSVSDGTTNQTFEFDSGYVLQIPVSGVSDGMKFTITNGLNPPVTFEYDRNNSITPGNVRITLSSSSTQNDIADATVAAIRGVAGLGLSPVNISGGKVWLGGTVNHTVSVAGTTLTVSGQPGAQTAGAIAVPFIPGVKPSDATAPIMTSDQVAESMVQSIQGSGLTGVRASWRSYNLNSVQVVELVVRGASAVSGFTTTFTPAIKDLAGNDLKANQLTGETTYTIFLGNGVDYGDAPIPYPTNSTNAASHSILIGFQLGAAVDAEPTGQPTVAADGDNNNGIPNDEDGVVFNSPIAVAGTVTLTVTAAKTGVAAGQFAGYLDAFIDFNRDGDFDDAGDRVFATKALNAGSNTLTFVVPDTASVGTTYARFRFSSTGGLAATGSAIDGEVEDYQVVVGGPPWQNASKPNDVNNDTFVSPIDALLVVNFLNTYTGISSLPNPPPFVPISGNPIYPDNTGTGNDFFIDVNGDGFVSPIDALIVINVLNAGGGGEALGEGEGDAGSFSLAAFGAGLFSVGDTSAAWRSSDVGTTVAGGTNSTHRANVAEFAFTVGDAPSTVSTATAREVSLVNESGEVDVLDLDGLFDQLAATDANSELGEAHDQFFADWA